LGTKPFAGVTGRFRGGAGRADWARARGREAAVFGLEVLEFLEGVAVVALGGVDAPLEAGEILGVIPESLGEFDLRFGLQGELGALLPELGFDDTETAEEPFGVDEGVDEHALLGAVGW